MVATATISIKDPINGYGTNTTPRVIPLATATTDNIWRVHIIGVETGSFSVLSIIVEITMISMPAMNSANAKTRWTYMSV